MHSVCELRKLRLGRLSRCSNGEVDAKTSSVGADPKVQEKSHATPNERNEATMLIFISCLSVFRVAFVAAWRETALFWLQLLALVSKIHQSVARIFQFRDV